MMEEINSVLTGGLEQYAFNQEKTRPKDELGQSQFLELMITQIKHQDPLNPQESGEFLSQLAQFGTVNGITELQSSFEQLAVTLQSSQALQASTMVGRSVLIPGNVGLLETGVELQGAVDLPASSGDLKVFIQDAAGQLVKQINLGTQQAGLARFSWDGTSDSGAAVATGTYSVSAQATVDGTAVSQQTLIQAKVDSVTLGKAGGDSSLNLRGLGTVFMNNIREIL
jgi:flagellar basal-body rod modification protein FlgD